MSRVNVWAALVALAVLGPACEPGGIGDPCTPEAEYDPSFAGFDLREVSVESRSYQCSSRVCLVNHFQGRVTCPYGQRDQDLGLGPDDPRRCRTPGSSEPVSVPVAAWNVQRPPDDAVYCSCRCAGPDPTARYCECPSGYTCAPVARYFGIGAEQRWGSFCIKEGTAFDAAATGPLTCDVAPESTACDGAPLVNP